MVMAVLGALIVLSDLWRLVTGKLDDEALFYLRARGINLEDARELLTYAFASGIVEQIPVEAVRAELDHVLHKRLSFSHSNEVSV